MRTTRQTLLRKARDPANARAWEEFFDQYAGPIQGFALKLGFGPADAADVLQETMVELIRLLPEFAYNPARGRFRNFVLTVARHKIQAARRRMRARNAGPLDTQCLRAPADEPPSSEEERAWREEVAAEALRRLRADPKCAPKTRAIFQAHVVEHRPAAEVARAFGVTANNVHQIKHRLLTQLRATVALLTEELDEPS